MCVCGGVLECVTEYECVFEFTVNLLTFPFSCTFVSRTEYVSANRACNDGSGGHIDNNVSHFKR